MSADAPWPSIRANNRNTAATSFDGPDEPELRWTHEAETVRGPVIVGHDGNLYFSAGNGMCSLDSSGDQRWHHATAKHHSTSVPTMHPDGRLVSTVANAGMLLVTQDGEASEVPGPAKFASASCVTIDDDGLIHFGIRYVTANGQVLEGGFRCDGTGEVCARTGPSKSEHPAITAAGHLLSKSETRFSFGGDPTECNDAFEEKTLDGRLISDQSTEGYASAGDCWGSNQWGGNCQAMCTEDGTPIVGVGKHLNIGSNFVEVEGHGFLALSPDGLVITGSREGICAVDLDGRNVWKHEANGAHPVIDGNGRIYFADANGRVYCVDSEGDTVWTWQIPSESYYSRGPTLSIADGMLLVPHDGKIYALG